MDELLSKIGINNPLLRIRGRHMPANAVAARAVTTLDATLVAADAPDPAAIADDDYAQIDPDLQIAQAPPARPDHALRAGLGYAGLTPQQRFQFLRWSEDPAQPAPLGFLQLYVAHLEVNLLDQDATQAARSRQELVRLQLLPHWQGATLLQRAALLSFWLAQDGESLARWLAHTAPAPELAGIGLGWQARRQVPLSTGELVTLITTWSAADRLPDAEMLGLRLSSLHASLGQEPLAYALAVLGEEGQAPRPWRCSHRDLRIALPQPDLRPVLQPLLEELLESGAAYAHAPGNGVHLLREDATGSDAAMEPDDDTDNDPDSTPAMQRWHLVLEFGHSRSEYFPYALHLAQQAGNFSQLLDEDRRLVYRVMFEKRKLRKFWRLWDYVQNWSSTRVYVNGEEMEKWKIWPYSQYLR